MRPGLTNRSLCNRAMPHGAACSMGVTEFKSGHGPVYQQIFRGSLIALAHALVAAQTAIERRALHWGGALAMGIGIWAMHFIGMLSHKMTLAVEYDPWITLLSLLIAIGVAYGVFVIVARQELTPPQILIGGTL